LRSRRKTNEYLLEKVGEADLALRVLQARALVEHICTCWAGCNDREGKLPCPHDILWEGIKLWIKKFPTAKSARYR
jgi:hypothetical protein